MSLISIIREAECIHDGERRGEQVGRALRTPSQMSDYDVVSETRVWCGNCEALLYETQALLNGTRKETDVDDVHRALYTRAGRKALLIELMERHALPLPRYWCPLT